MATKSSPSLVERLQWFRRCDLDQCKVVIRVDAGIRRIALPLHLDPRATLDDMSIREQPSIACYGKARARGIRAVSKGI